MGFVEDVQYKISIGLKKAVKAAIASGVAWVCTWIFQKFGVEISVEHQASFVIFFTGAFAGLLNFLKIKFPKQLGWL